MAQQTKRVVVTVAGLALIVVGAFLLVLPGPGILIIFAGLAVLGSEYAWAKRALEWARDRYQDGARRYRARNR